MSNKRIYALGFFDGVHLGHQALLTACRSLAEGLGLEAGVVTFGDHPDMLVHGKQPGLINTLADRERLLKNRALIRLDGQQPLPFPLEALSFSPAELSTTQVLQRIGLR